MDKLRQLGLRQAKSAQPAAQLKCPGCKSMLRIQGVPGDRCEWCGHEF
jgi:rRNA maturation endonuclease Nob1